MCGERLLKITEQRHGDGVVLGSMGRIINDTSREFHDRLMNWVRRPEAGVVLDFSGVDYISSARLRTLMIAYKQSNATNGRLAIAALKPIVRKSSRLADFPTWSLFKKTVEEALAVLTLG